MLQSIDPVTDLPEPTVELMVMGQIVEAILRSLPKRRRERFLDQWMHVADGYEALGSVVRLKHSMGTAAQVGACRRQSVAWSRAMAEMVRRVPSPQIAG